MDASAFLDLGERHYPESVPIFSPIWEFIYEGIESGLIVSVDYVKIELEKKADEWRTNFLLKANDMFQMSDEIESEYAKVISEIERGGQFNVNKARDKFVSGADPWLIAMARSIGSDATVISAEKKTLSGYGLGAVCNELNVRHINLVAFFVENNIGNNS